MVRAPPCTSRTSTACPAESGIHTQFSLPDGAAAIPNLYKKAIADGQPAVAITDHGNMFGAFKFVAEAGKHKNEDGSLKVKPIVGCEFYLVEDRHRKTFTREEKDRRYHQLLLAKYAEGYRNLSKLCSLGFIEGYYSKYQGTIKRLETCIGHGPMEASHRLCRIRISATPQQQRQAACHRVAPAASRSRSSPLRCARGFSANRVPHRGWSQPC